MVGEHLISASVGMFNGRFNIGLMIGHSRERSELAGRHQMLRSKSLVVKVLY